MWVLEATAIEVLPGNLEPQTKTRYVGQLLLGYLILFGWVPAINVHLWTSIFSHQFAKLQLAVCM